jgi:hypothetical protein
MSRIFDVQLDAPGPYYALGVQGSNRFKLEKYGARGPNQMTLPAFANKDELETITFSKGATGKFVESELSSPATYLIQHDIVAHDLVHKSNDLESVKSSIKQYWEVHNRRHTAQVAQFSPKPHIRSNKATYLLDIHCNCSKTEFVELQLGNGDKLSVCGDFKLLSRDPSVLSVLAKMPGKSMLRLSYAQILPQKDSVLKLLARRQYGQGPF